MHIIENITLFCMGIWFAFAFGSPIAGEWKVDRNGMKVRWQFEGENIRFEMLAETTGWLAIGFNESTDLPGTYLLMGRVVDGQAEVQEFKTLAPGDYRPIQSLGGQAVCTVISGEEGNGRTKIQFSIPAWLEDGFHKKLVQGSTWPMLIAYSREDDFRHHSMMRGNVRIEL